MNNSINTKIEHCHVFIIFHSSYGNNQMIGRYKGFIPGAPRFRQTAVELPAAFRDIAGISLEKWLCFKEIPGRSAGNRWF
jgi:hypothetical protein